jgi:ribosomal-protein-alanine N-acetyltransferase
VEGADLALPRVLAETQAANHRSRRLLERLGMTATRTAVRFGARQIIYELMQPAATGS